jgi:hypothetical protein
MDFQLKTIIFNNEDKGGYLILSNNVSFVIVFDFTIINKETSKNIDFIHFTEGRDHSKRIYSAMKRKYKNYDTFHIDMYEDVFYVFDNMKKEGLQFNSTNKDKGFEYIYNLLKDRVDFDKSEEDKRTNTFTIEPMF